MDLGYPFKVHLGADQNRYQHALSAVLTNCLQLKIHTPSTSCLSPGTHKHSPKIYFIFINFDFLALKKNRTEINIFFLVVLEITFMKPSHNQPNILPSNFLMSFFPSFPPQPAPYPSQLLVTRQSLIYLLSRQVCTSQSSVWLLT